MAFPTTKSDVVDNVDDVMADHINAIEDKIGSGAANNEPASGKLLRGTGAGTSQWDKDAPAGDIVGTTDTQNLSNKTFTDQLESNEDLNLATDKNIQENDVDPFKSIFLPAGVIEPTTTSGCAAVATVEAGTNDIDYKLLDFDKTTQENSFVNFQMPGNWDAGVIQFRFLWTAAAGSGAETFELEVAGRSYADDDAIDQAVGTYVGASDALIATGDVHNSAWSGDLTFAGTALAGEWVHLEFRRDVDNDTLDADARLIGVQLRYKESQYNHF